MRLHTQAQHTSVVVWSKDVVDTPTSEYLSVCQKMDGYIILYYISDNSFKAFLCKIESMRWQQSMLGDTVHWSLFL